MLGDNGLRVIRFHKWFYIFSEDDNRYRRMGLRIVGNIPKDAAEYQEWLIAQREIAKNWENLYESFLSVKPGNKVTTRLPHFMEKQLPTLFPPGEDLIYAPSSLDCTYTVDLNREIFSFNDHNHFKLERVPHIKWEHNRFGESLVDRVYLPDPKGVTDSMIDHFIQSNELSKPLNDISMNNTPSDAPQRIVPKGIKDIPWRQRQGPILRAIIFHFWACANVKSLSATFRQLSPQDLPFREMAYAVLCLAAGGRHVNLLPSRNVSSNSAFGFIHEECEHTADSEFVSILASGAHLQGSSPGTSPEDTIYWLDDVLVVLTAELYHAGAAGEGIARIVRYCQNHCATEYVDAVLISVEHVVLVHVAPDGKVQHTVTMPLFDREAKDFWERLSDHEVLMEKRNKRCRKTDQERPLTNEAVDLDHGMDRDEEVESDEEDESALYTTLVDGNFNSTFYALVHLFEAAACKHMPRAGVTAGRLPNEIYTRIIKQVTDMETRGSLMKVSGTFRRICQEDLLFAEGLIVKPSHACQSCDEATRIPKWFETYDTITDTQSRATVPGLGPEDRYNYLSYRCPSKLRTNKMYSDSEDSAWRVAIGRERNKRSLLTGVAVKFVTA